MNCRLICPEADCGRRLLERSGRKRVVGEFSIATYVRGVERAFEEVFSHATY